jgi:hypothetical protein
MPITRLQTESLYALMNHIYSLYTTERLDYEYFSTHRSETMNFIREHSKNDANEITKLVSLILNENTNLFEYAQKLTNLYNRLITVFYTMSDVAKVAEKIYGKNCSVVTVDWDMYAKDFEKSFILFQEYQRKTNKKQQVKKQKII